MNVKIILFCVASLGSFMMLYMWFTMNRAVSNSQLIEEQYLYRISSLKSEIDFEKRLMESLRKDTKNYGKSYYEKSILLENMIKKEKTSDNERIRLEKETETLKQDYEKVSKSNDEQMKKIKTESDSKKAIDDEEIEKLTNELKKYQVEKDDLVAKQKKSLNTNSIKSQFDNVKPSDDIMQGKPPVINKMNQKSKEVKDEGPDVKTEVIISKVVENIKSKLNQTQEYEKKNVKTPGKTKVEVFSNFEKVESNPSNLKNEVINKIVLSKDNQGKDKKEGESQVEPPALNVKNDNSNDDVIAKDDYFNKNQYNPKILKKDSFKQDANVDSQKDINKSQNNFEKDTLKGKGDEDLVHVNRQLKPPKKEKQQREKYLVEGLQDKSRIKKENNLVDGEI